MTIKELREKRQKLLADARSIRDAADKEGKRALKAEEIDQVDKILAEHKSVSDELGRLEADARLRTFVDEGDRSATEPTPRRIGDEPPHQGKGRDGDQPPAQARRFEYDLSQRRNAKRVIHLAGRTLGDEYCRDYRRFLASGQESPNLIRGGEARDLQADSGPDGGYLVAPIQMAANMIKAVDDQVWIRQFATVEQVPKAQSLGVVSLDADPDDGEWTSELGTGTPDTKMKFGRREMNPQPLSKEIKLSRKLLRMAMNIESMVAERLAYKFAITQEKNFLVGDGANKPLGVFTASAQGISTGRDVSTGNTTTAISADNAIQVKMSLKAPYRSRANWLFHRTVLTQYMLLKDSQGQYLWRQGLTTGEPDTLLGLPVRESEFAPNVMTTGKYVGMLADWSFYYIAESLQLEIQRLEELYAKQNQVGFIGRMELDAMPILEEAFARVKLA